MIQLNKIILSLLFVSCHTVFGQEVIGRIDANIIQKNSVKSCTEWTNGQKGRTVFYNSLGLPDQYRFLSSAIDSTGTLIEGDFGKRVFEYDSSGNLLTSTMTSYEPTIDSTIVLTQIRNHYDTNNLLVKKEYFDTPTSIPTVVNYYYVDSLLMKEVKLKSTNSLKVTSEFFNEEVIYYTYDSLNRLSSMKSFWEGNPLDSTSISYNGDTTTWKQFNQSNQLTSIVSSVFDDQRREIERIYTDKTCRWIYQENGLLDKIAYLYLTTNSERMTEFTYEFE